MQMTLSAPAAVPAARRAPSRASRPWRRARLPMAAALLLSLPGTAAAQGDLPAPATISVQGMGEVQAAPDMASIGLGVITMAPQAAEAMAGNAVAMQRILDALAAAGVAARDVQTRQITVNPRWSMPAEGEEARIIGYEAGNRVTVRMRDLSALGSVLDALVEAGANHMDSLSFGLEEPQPLQDAARVAAVQDAARKAALLAEAAGLELGRVLSISEGGSNGGGPVPLYAAREAMAATPVAEGELTVSASVSMVWELQAP